METGDAGHPMGFCEMSGKLYGIGVGPGDPELMTMRAHRLISSAKIIAYPAPDSGESFARSIAAASFAADVVEIPIVIPMRVARFPAQDVYDDAAKEIGRHLLAGQDVVVLCEGDPFFYGSFMYLFSRLAGDFPTEVVPGVSSLGAVTAAARQPLCARGDQVLILPATIDENDLLERLSTAQAAAIMKVGRNLNKVRRVLNELDLAERAVFVSHASLPEQKVLPFAEAPETAPYFSMILIPGEDPHV